MANTLGSIAISGLKTTAKWVDHFVVEVYADAAFTQFITGASSPAVWQTPPGFSTYFNCQANMIILNGLTWGQTYHLRAGVAAPITDIITWTSLTVTMGGATVPAPSFTVGWTIAPGGVEVTVTPSGIPTDLDHYEAIWHTTNTTPNSSDIANWRGVNVVGQSYFRFFVGASGAATIYVWVRAINTTQIAQAWVNIGSTVAAQLDPTSAALLTLGSVPPTVNNGMAYVAGTSYIDWYWDGSNGSATIVLYRADGTQVSVPHSKVGTASLSASTTYYFYPFFKEASTGGPGVGFTGGGVGTNDGAVNTSGGAGIALTTKSLAAAANTMTAGYLPISSGGMAAQTTASSTSTGTSGGSGGGYTAGSWCPRHNMVVYSKDRGVIPVQDAAVGEWILSRNGEWTQIQRKAPQQEFTFCRIEASNGDHIDQTLETPMPLARGEKLTRDLSLNDLINVIDIGSREERYAQIRSLQILDEEDLKWVISCLPTPEFYCAAISPSILTHNTIMIK